MLSRRSFLFGVGTITMAQILAGCKAESGDLRVLLLENSIPPQLIGKFRSTTSQSSIFTPEPQLKTLLSLLETWQNKDSSENPQKSWLPWGNKKSSPVADLVTLGDGWLKGAIEQKLISPLDINELSQWPQLPPRWQEIVQRNQLGMVDPQGQIWGAPYRWGTTMIVYRSDILKKFDWQPTDWSDLWREELQGRISLLNQPREVIGLTLKKLGYSYNTENISQIPNLKSELVALNNQTKIYSSNYYLQPLILGDIWLAVGWSNEIIPLLSRRRDLKAIVPQSGTALWADVWVKPTSDVKLSNLAQEWINFCWQPTAVQQISLYTDAVSPLILDQNSEKLPKVITSNPLLFIEPTILNKSEFIKPLPPSIQAQYDQLWKEVRTVNS